MQAYALRTSMATRLSLAYGVNDSMMVLLAPGTDKSQDDACTAPPVVTKTHLVGFAWMTWISESSEESKSCTMLASALCLEEI
jgi:hypothetical protein